MRCALTITGKVQNAGYRGFIEDKARDRHLRGYVFNASDGSVQLVCDGAGDKIDDLVDVITLHEKDIFVENILKDNVVDPVSPLPDTFGRVKTDTKEDTNRKLDKGVDAIRSVKEDTLAIRNDTGAMVSILEKHTGLLETNTKLLETSAKFLERIAEK